MATGEGIGLIETIPGDFLNKELIEKIGGDASTITPAFLPARQ